MALDSAGSGKADRVTWFSYRFLRVISVSLRTVQRWDLCPLSVSLMAHRAAHIVDAGEILLAGVVVTDRNG